MAVAAGPRCRPLVRLDGQHTQLGQPQSSSPGVKQIASGATVYGARLSHKPSAIRVAHLDDSAECRAMPVSLNYIPKLRRLPPGERLYSS
jgi:hypothetical protein